MKKKTIVSLDSDFFGDKEDIIKLESCLNDGNGCKEQLPAINDILRLIRQLIEDKKHGSALLYIKEAYNSTYEIKGEQCQKCSSLFRETIINSLNFLVLDLKQLTKGILGNDMYKNDLDNAEKLLMELKQYDSIRSENPRA